MSLTHSASTKPRPGRCRLSAPSSSCIFAFLIRDVEISSRCILASGQRGREEAADGNEAQQGLLDTDLIARWSDVRTQGEDNCILWLFDAFLSRGVRLLPAAPYMQPLLTHSMTDHC
ncbi:hypothetical protein PAXRUDRAFT_180401 [Paxillus rubicundulus Ve08.2h10]|uniref:Uncharacterized protein n=1 Tax=Paxillus rubicundulus Ve08.2h10 TaxID=930991 RepID=A0A0D0CP50_9AGAM|nr:hypothetical protein PAXRUDRAFT_180401 [Paxillus rubicundulus Ve08.2h10]